MTGARMLTVISSEYDGMILREYLRNVLRLSRAELTELKKRDDGIMLNGVRVTVRALLKDGDELILSRDDIASSEGVKPVPLPLDILYEDDDVIALNKPPFMPTHPSHEHQSDTLANALAYYFESKGIPFVFRAVNRLDRDTSGVVLVAKNKNSAFVLAKQIAEFKVTKKYIAIVDGEVLSSGEIEGNIRRIEDGKMRRGVFPDGQYALTEYEVLGVKNGLSALLVSPKTGRTHQIRVHTSYIGHPILGDTLYGDENGSELISRQALHAYSLTFSLPSNNETITVTAPLPSDMASIGVYEQDQD
ncbi:MAG: RluA family pseudouridine synthase [Ruminococcaceae bacterium]|nr:RluA family pseudouridine synthase [Oscillospiraceae bacterium]